MLVLLDENLPYKLRLLSYQQNLKGRKLAFVVLSSNEREIVVTQVAQIIAAINAVTVGGFSFVDIG